MSELSARDRKRLNAIEADLWTSDPEYYRHFDQTWCRADARREQADKLRTRRSSGPDAGRRGTRRSLWWSRPWQLSILLIVLGFVGMHMLVSGR